MAYACDGKMGNPRSGRDRFRQAWRLEMSVAEFKKKVSPSLIPTGTIVFLRSDDGETVPMTIMESKAEKVYCRWFNDLGDLQGDWFAPPELFMADAKEAEPELEVDAK
jgi:hypothetical protein